jgi:hypothetical protein
MCCTYRDGRAGEASNGSGGHSGGDDAAATKGGHGGSSLTPHGHLDCPGQHREWRYVCVCVMGEDGLKRWCDDADVGGGARREGRGQRPRFWGSQANQGLPKKRLIHALHPCTHTAHVEAAC